MQKIGETDRFKQLEKTIIFEGADELNQSGYVLQPRAILKNPNISPGAKNVYSLLIDYGWNNEYCFPGQDRIAEDMGMSVSRINEFIKELESFGVIEITRRGQGKTNIYRIKFRIAKTAKAKS